MREPFKDLYIKKGDIMTKKDQLELNYLLEDLKKSYGLDITAELFSIIAKTEKIKNELENEKNYRNFQEYLGELINAALKNINSLFGIDYKDQSKKLIKWKAEAKQHLEHILDHIEDERCYSTMKFSNFVSKQDLPLVCHPYELTSNEMEKLITYCKENDLECFLEGKSAYKPLYTMTLTIGKTVIPLRKRVLEEGFFKKKLDKKDKL